MKRKDDSELQRLTHELQVHQAELESQNLALREIGDDLARSRDRFAALFDEAPVGFLVLDAKGVIVDANPAAARLLFDTTEGLIGQRLRQRVSAESMPCLGALIDRTADATSPGSGELFVEHAGRHRPLRAESHVLRHAPGRAPEILLALTDATREKEAEARWALLLEDEKRIRQQRIDEERQLSRLARFGSAYLDSGRIEDILAEIVDAAVAVSGADFGNIQLLDAGGRLVIAAQRGLPEWWVEYWNAACDEHCACGAALARGERILVENIEESPLFVGSPHLEVQRRAGIAAVQSTPLIDRSGRTIGILSTHYRQARGFDERVLKLLDILARRAADIIERDRVDNALRAQDENLRLAARAARFGTFNGDLAAGTTYWSPDMRELVGVAADAPAPTPLVVPDFIHPADINKVKAMFARALDPHGNGTVSGEHRIVRPDGSVHWVQVRGQAEFADRNGQRSALHVRGIVLDITELKEAELALREADRHKNEFLAVLAHELRNPLAPIGNALDILRLAGDDESESASAIAVIERQLGHLVHLVDDLLDVNRITRGQMQLHRERLELRPLLEQTIDALRPQLAEAGLELSLTLPARAIHLDADPVRLAQIVFNLLNNAAKYTPSGGRVALSAERHDDQALLTVADSGVGMDAGTLGRIFEMFFQVSDSTPRSNSGLGIGLWLARRLAELHGGSIEAMSDGPGRGSRFQVRLPALPESAATRRRSAPPRIAADAPRHVLIADDNRDITESLAQLLRLTGHQVAVAHDGQQAVEVVAARAPEVVLLDISMPGIDGYETCRRLRQLPGGDKLLILALTGYGQDDDRRRADDAGFDGHILKPVRLATLQKTIDRLARKRPAAPSVR